MSEIIVRNADLRTLATKVRQVVQTEVLGDTRSVNLKDQVHPVLVTFADDIPSAGTRVQVWLGKTLLMEHLYCANISWPDADDYVERTTLLNLLAYYYKVLWANTDLDAILKSLLDGGNASIKLPNGQTLKSEVRHRAGGNRSVSLVGLDDYPIFSMITYVEDRDQSHITKCMEHHFTQPGFIGPGEHSITVDSGWVL